MGYPRPRDTATFPPTVTLDIPAPPHPMADPPAEPALVAPRRRVRGFQIRALPSVPLVAQLGGGAAALAGVYLAWGTAIALIVGGVAAVALGALREGGKI
jgi:hypothetical protein